MMKKMMGSSIIWACIIVFYNGNVWAGNADILIKAHKKALKQYQENQDETQAFITLQLAGIKGALERRPEGMREPEYIQMLNDFAFFRYQSATFKKGVSALAKDGETVFKGDERGKMLVDQQTACPIDYYYALGQVLDIFGLGDKNDSWMQENLLTVSCQDNTGEVSSPDDTIRGYTFVWEHEMLPVWINFKNINYAGRLAA